MNIELTGMRTGEGKTITAMKKAYDAATNGINTLLICTEMTPNSVIKRYKEQLGIENFNDIPLSFISTGSVDMDVLYKMFRNKIATENIKYIVFDHIPVNPKQVLEYDKYRLVFNNLKEEFDVEILAYYQKPFNQ